MMKLQPITDFETRAIGDRIIVVKGIGKMFYQDGFPISMSISECKKEGIEVSILHIARECLRNGWSAKTTYNKLKSDFEDDIEHNIYDLELLEKFCYATYEDQCEMIFEYLFNCSSMDMITNIHDSKEDVQTINFRKVVTNG